VLKWSSLLQASRPEEVVAIERDKLLVVWNISRHGLVRHAVERPGWYCSVIRNLKRAVTILLQSSEESVFVKYPFDFLMISKHRAD